MAISKFNLYRSEWLELVFDKRNKEYGAYELRHHYAQNMVRAMAITFSLIGLLCMAVVIFHKAPALISVIPVDNSEIQHIIPPVVPPVKRPVEPPAHASTPLKPVNPPATIKDVAMVPVPDNLAQQPVKNADLADKTISDVTNDKGAKGGGNALDNPDPGPTTTPGPDNTLYTAGGVDVMPEPVGGMSAFAKFLSKNLRFPPEARENGQSGRVIMSFVIERDGSLSNITVLRPAGSGFDEEALRVLKLAKAWKPGKQNGQPVRVSYVIPINFQLSDDSN